MPLLSETEPTSDEYETVGAPDSQHEGVTMDDVPPGILSNYFSNILNIARAAALKSRQYNSNKTRHDITLEFEKAFDGKTPYEWQVDVTEALLLRLDCIVIAGTGAGKTMPFAMPLLLDKTKRKMVIVVSPLKELQKDQAERFKKMGIKAVAVSGENWNKELHMAIVNREHQIILASPEMLLEHPEFSKLMRNPEFTQDITTIVVDEVHCISQWGDDFRKSYQQLNKLRSCVAIDVPFLAASATLPPTVLAEVQLYLCISMERMFLVNLGNDRHNITPAICRMRGGAKDLPALDFLTDEAVLGTPLKRTIVFFNARETTYNAYKYIQRLLPEDIKDQVDFVHSGRSPGAINDTMARFRCNETKILFATEAAGMGMDIPDIERVIQYMVPKSLSVWTQRLGRAGRSGQPALVIILVEPSVYQVRKSKVTALREPKKRKLGEDEEPSEEPDDDDEHEDEVEDEDVESDELEQISKTDVDVKTIASQGLVYVKRLEQGMRYWVECKTCRRRVANKYFKNPPQQDELTVPCCDNCLYKKEKELRETLPASELNMIRLFRRIELRDGPLLPLDAMSVDNHLQENPGTQETKIEKKTRRIGNREKERLATCRAELRSWRKRCWKNLYSTCIFGQQVILSDKILAKLAKLAYIQTVADIKDVIPEWIWADEHGTEVLDLLRPVDQEWRAQRDEEIRVKSDKRQKESERKATLRAEKALEKRQRETMERKAKKDAENTARFIHYHHQNPPSIPGSSQDVLRPVYPIPQPSLPHLQQFCPSYAHPASWPIYPPALPLEQNHIFSAPYAGSSWSYQHWLQPPLRLNLPPNQPQPPT